MTETKYEYMTQNDTTPKYPSPKMQTETRIMTFYKNKPFLYIRKGIEICHIFHFILFSMIRVLVCQHHRYGDMSREVELLAFCFIVSF